MAGNFKVYIEENSHFDDESGRIKIGEFENSDDALDLCRKIVDDFLILNSKDEITADELYQIYTMFGEDAFIVGEPSPYFSARQYAKMRCGEICSPKI